MPNPRQPINLIAYKGRKHLTAAEISARQSSEVNAPSDNIEPPKYLNKKQQTEFTALAAELAPLDILANIDAGELARYVVAHSLYAKYTKLIHQLPKKKAKRMRREAEERGEPIAADVTDEELALELEQELSYREGTTILLITHDDGIAATAPRVVRLSDGRIISDAHQEVDWL